MISMYLNLNKKFRVNRVRLSVQFWSFLASAFLKNGEVLTEVGRPYIMFVLKVFSDYGMFVLLNTLV